MACLSCRRAPFPNSSSSIRKFFQPAVSFFSHTACARDTRSARATVTGKDAANRELKKFYGDVLPPDQSAARRIIRAKIEELANSSNVKLLQEAFDPKQERGSDLGKLTATVLLMGEYRGIRRLIYGLETAPEFLILENVALSQVQERDQALNLTVKIATYYRAE